VTFDGPPLANAYLFLDRADGLIEVVAQPRPGEQHTGSLHPENIASWADTARKHLRGSEKPGGDRFQRSPRMVASSGLRLWVARVRGDRGIVVATWDGDTATESVATVAKLHEVDAWLTDLVASAERSRTHLAALTGARPSHAQDADAMRPPHPARAGLTPERCPPVDTLLVDSLLARFPEAPAMARPSNPAPRYPRNEQSAGVNGDVRVSVVVDTNGRALEKSIDVLQATTRAFALEVRRQLQKSQFYAAEVIPGCVVRQRIVMPYMFRINR
jgi:TonB family protein